MDRFNLNSKCWEIFTIIPFWYFYFSSSFVLRIFPSLVWCALAGIAIIFALLNHYAFKRSEAFFLLSFFSLIVFSAFAVSAQKSCMTVAYYFIYFCVALFVNKKVNSKFIVNVIFFFSLIHLFCTLLQIALPSLYSSTVLKMLPGDVRNEIIEQMNWNASYYGFTVQTSVNAMYLSIGALLCAIKIKYTEGRFYRVILLGLVAMFAVCVFFTARRGSAAVLLLLLSILYFKAKTSSFSKIVVVIFGLVFVLMVGVENIPGFQSILNKFSALDSNSSILNGRDTLFANAITAFWKRPLFGYGGGCLELATGRGILENSYIATLVEWGGIGVVLFWFPYFNMYRMKIQNMKRNRITLINELSYYIVFMFLLMSLVEDYFGAPLTTFILFVVIFLSEEEQKAVTENES